MRIRPVVRAEDQLNVHSCDYATEDGSYDAACGMLVVKENRRKADSRPIALPVTRVHARTANPGTPTFPPLGRSRCDEHDVPASEPLCGQARRRARRYRGVDGSSKLDCPEVASAREHAHESSVTLGVRSTHSSSDWAACSSAC
jgi:hypothetical protein